MYSWVFRFALIVVTSFPGLLFAVAPSSDWKTLHSDHFLIHHLPEYTDQAKRSALIAERIYKQLKPRFLWQPENKIKMVIADEHDQANGSATPYPFNLIYLRLSPPDSAVSLDDYDDWLTVLIEHELTHIFHIDKARGKIRRLRKTFGRFLLFFPNILQPTWMIEGLATYVETHQGIGRGQSSSFEMLMREEVRRGLQTVNRVNLPPDGQPLNRHYLYGVYFYQFLHEKYGERVISALIENYSDNILPFAINSNSKQVLGKDISALWDEYVVFLKNRFDKQLQVLKQSDAEPGQRVYDFPMLATELDVMTDGSLIYIEDNLESKAQLIKSKDSIKTVLTELNSGSGFSSGADNQIYITQVDVCDEYYLYYDLYRLDVETKELTRLTECQRYKKIAVDKNTNNIAAVATIASIPRIDILDKTGQKIKTLWTGQYGDVINQLDWSEKRNKLLVTKKELNKAWSIFELDLGNAVWSTLVAKDSLSMHAKYTLSEDGFIYTNDESGVFNIYRYSFDNDQSEAVTNVQSGAFSPAQKSTNEFYYLNYSADGYQIYQQSLKSKKVAQINQPEKFEIRYQESMLDSLPDYKITEYTPWPDLKPHYWLPIFIIQDQGSEIGFATSSNDSLNNHFYELNLSVGMDQEELLGSFYYQYANWLGFVLSKENMIFSDTLTADTNLIRANNQMQLIFSKPFTSLNHQWRIGLGYIGYNDKDIYRATGISGFTDAYDDLLGLSVFYNSSRRYLKGNSTETGRNVLLVSESSDVFKSDFEGISTTLEWREFIKLGSHNTLALRYVRGSADITMRPFKLGGLKTEWDDVTIFNPAYSRDIFNKRYFALRGYNDNTQTGNNIEMMSVEWRFPIMHVEKGIMIPPVGIMKHSGRLFTEAGSSWNDTENKNVISSAGFEWVMDTNLVYYINIQFRFGYAKGLDETGDEFYYFKAGTAF